MVSTRRVTVEEFETIPLEGHWELIDGEPIALSPAGGHAGWVAGQICFHLRDHVRDNALGWTFCSGAGFVLFEGRATVRAPGAAFIRRERLPGLTDHFVPVAPDLAVDVLSPWDHMPEALAKIAMYLQAGVQLVWLVDPEKRTVTVFRPNDTIEIARAGDVLDGGEVVPGFSVAVEEIFG